MAVAAAAGSVRDSLGASGDALAAAGVEDPGFDARLLLAEAMGVEPARIAAEPDAPVPAPAARAFGAFVRRRIQREPVAYILGSKGFRHIELEVDRRVLIPRPETELLVDIALESAPGRLLDIGTGSGAVALAIADELPGCEVTATDTSAAALAVARSNAGRLGLSDRVRFLRGSVPAEGDFDLTVANLPYVATGDWGGLQAEITRFEPREALVAGEEGLDAYRQVIPQVTSPAVALEVGEGQARAVGSLLGDAGFTSVEVRPDLAGIDRVVVGTR